MYSRSNLAASLFSRLSKSNISKSIRVRKNTCLDDGYADIRRNIIGHDHAIQTPFGARELLYADYVASGRAYGPIEDKIRDQVLPLYANTHTESSATGRQSTAYREEARQIIADSLNCNKDDGIIFCGSGCTGAIDKLIGMLGLRLPIELSAYGVTTEIDPIKKPVVFVGPYEHHSNDVQWRESLAEVVTIEETSNGQIDLGDLEKRLEEYKDRPLLIGSFSAASNVTGILTDTAAIARVIHEYGGLAAFDYAAAAPYMSIDMNAPNNAHMDAVFISPHKFLGGPGTPGLLVVKKKWANNQTPVIPGGGTVSYVSPCAQSYLTNVEHREEGGTPEIIGAIRAGQAFALQSTIGADKIAAKEHALSETVIERWGRHENIQILGSTNAPRLPFFSFLIRRENKYLHHNFVVALLNDLFGIQSRGGCSCAGPYGHRLLDIDIETSTEFQSFIDQGIEILKPGWIRLGFNYFFSEAETNFILEAVEWIADNGYKFLPLYKCDSRSSLWVHLDSAANPVLSLMGASPSLRNERLLDRSDLIEWATHKAQDIPTSSPDRACDLMDSAPPHLRWFI